jgi:adenosylcobinamide-GDP ribazoletransferase
LTSAGFVSSFWLALTFLTTLPAPRVAFDATAFGRSGRWYPLVGLLVGGLLAGVHWAGGLLFPPLLTSVVVVTAWAVLSGGLHLDGLADCCDGFFAPVDRERRMEIMRDPRVGTFGALGLLIVLGLKVAALSASTLPVAALVLTPMWARWLILPAARQPQARPSGMGSTFAAGLTPTTLGVAVAVPLLTTLAAIAITGRAGAIIMAVAVAHLVLLGVGQLARHKLGGVTGDVFGLVVESSEVAMLLVFAAALPA